MSKENLKVKQVDSNDEDERHEAKSQSWNYPDTFTPQGRTCCSPADELETQCAEEKFSTMQSVEVQTEKSTLFSLKQDKKINKAPMDQSNEFLNVKLRKTGLNCEHEKISTKFPVNINVQVLDKYNETDIDQPTDYTICYNETNLEEEKKENTAKNEFLLIEETIEEEKIGTAKSKGSSNKELPRNKKDMFSSSRSFKEIFNFFKDRDKKRSHESSKSSSSEGSKILKTSETYEQKIDRSPQSCRSSAEQSEKESKSRSESQGAQQTPLIFSRCSSLGSLTGIEQSSVNDDRSSIISDFSHKTSGRVSPSELPDSPAQLASPNVKTQQKCQISCFGKKKIPLVQQDKIKTNQQPLPTNDSYQLENNLKKLPFVKTSIFEDYLTSFKDESTPTKLHSMAASSLSSLTIDDDDDFELVNKNITGQEKQNVIEETKKDSNRQEPVGESNNETDSVTEPETTEIPLHVQENYNREEDDQLMDLAPYEEQLLDECIRRGIAKWTKQHISEIKPFSWDVGLTCLATKALIATTIRMNAAEIVSEIVEKHKNDLVLISQSNSHPQNENYENSDEKCNENSSVRNSVFTDNSNYVTYEEHLLDQCIRRGIAKITKKNINDITPFSWDTNQICLTTRAMLLHAHDDYNGICVT